MRKYVRPALDVLEIDVDDVITASSPSASSDDPPVSETDNAYGSFGSFDQTPANGWF